MDSLYGASALAMLAKATGDQKYIDIMNAFFDDVTGQLLDKECGLYYRDPRFIGQRTAEGKEDPLVAREWVGVCRNRAGARVSSQESPQPAALPRNLPPAGGGIDQAPGSRWPVARQPRRPGPVSEP